jgi:hypothetical protein
MTTITINGNVEQSIIDRVLTLLRREKVSFTFESATQENEQDALRTAAIRERLRVKYVLNGEWASMDDEDRQDAALLEGMLYDKEQPDYEVYSEADTKNYLNNLKKQLHAL